MRKFNRAKSQVMKMKHKNLHYLLTNKTNKRNKIIKNTKPAKEIFRMSSNKLYKVSHKKKLSKNLYKQNRLSPLPNKDSKCFLRNDNYFK